MFVVLMLNVLSTSTLLCVNVRKDILVMPFINARSNHTETKSTIPVTRHLADQMSLAQFTTTTLLFVMFVPRLTQFTTHNADQNVSVTLNVHSTRPVLARNVSIHVLALAVTMPIVKSLITIQSVNVIMAWLEIRLNNALHPLLMKNL